MRSAPIVSSLPNPTRSLITHPYPHPASRGAALHPSAVALRSNLRSDSRASAVNDIVSVPAQAEVTWEIVVGTLAGVAPFVVAGIEFRKRIVAQQKCRVCKGSGLVLRENKFYFRCPACGGFLPWQSWRRFFTG